MKGLLDAQDVLDEIEFELLQGEVLHGSLGEALQRVRKNHAEVRREVADILGGQHRNGWREVVSRQLAVNEMLITLQQRLYSELQEVRLVLRRLQRLVVALDAAKSTRNGDNLTAGSSDGFNRFQHGESGDPSVHTGMPTLTGMGVLHNVTVVPQVGKLSIPLIGGLLTRARAALHNLVLFYVNRLAQKQSDINGQLISRMVELTRVCQAQQEQIDVLQAQLKILLSRLDKCGSLSNGREV